ncbi:MAG: SDR family oxidoreductase [Clostridia bacterium]|nr:SDR family oxidoreductase [Clostridia bacterium]
MKTVLVTGGVRGIGLSVCEGFLKKGYRVCTCYSKDENGAKTARKKGIETFRADVSKEADVVALFQAIGKVDILINNAGVSLFKQIQDVTEADVDVLFAVNVKGAILCAREAAKQMIARKEGLIVQISSVWGEVGGSCESVYSATKAALLGFTKALAKEVGYSGVRVNCISPGVIDTAMNARFSQEELSALQEEIPVGRLGQGEDVAKAALYLDEATYVTGINLPVNGGFSIV